LDLWHLTIASDGRRALFPAEEGRRAAVRVLARVVGPAALLFCVVDDHLHLVVGWERLRVGWLGRALVLGLRPFAAAPVEGARVRPVESRAHLESLVGYVLSQTGHHGLAEHPALWTGSCFQDLVGARWLPPLEVRARLTAQLPRLSPSALFAAAGMPSGSARSFAPSDDAALRVGGASRLVAAAAAALALPPSLAGKGAALVLARRAVAQLGIGCGLASGDLGLALGVTPRAVRRLLAAPAPDALLGAVRRRHALVEALAGTPPLPARSP
jgi:hypothetical protein